MCLLSTISWIQIASSCVLDTITFWSFIFDLNKVFLSMIIISSGNSIGDFFGNGALAKLGNEVMAMMGCFSGQLFNLLIGLFFNFILSDNKKFDIFGSAGQRNLNQKFTIMLFTFAFGVIILHTGNLFLNHFKVKKNFKYVLVLFYLAFIITSVFVLLSNK